MEIRQVAEMLYKSNYAVCLTGREMIVEDGIDSMRDMETAYEIEMKYGYSPEEVFSARFFNTRAERFYEFYREEVLAQDKEPGPAYTALAEMEELGVLKAAITRQLYDFCKRAGCKNVYNLHGNIYERNHCPRCGKTYPLEYIRNSEKVPLCEKCRVTIHPGVTLLGEMVEIGLLTKAAEEVARADTILLAGVYMNSELAQQFLRYYKGSRVILVHSGHHYCDKDADYFVEGATAEILPAIVEEMKKLHEEEKAQKAEAEKAEAEKAEAERLKEAEVEEEKTAGEEAAEDLEAEEENAKDTKEAETEKV